MNKKLTFISLLILFACTIVYSFGSFEIVNSIDAPIENTQLESHQEVHSEEVHGEEEHSSGHGGMEPLLFVIISLLIGAATRHFLRKSPLPFTVMLMLIGIGMGVLNRTGIFAEFFASFGVALSWAGNIDPHVILFVFLTQMK